MVGTGGSSPFGAYGDHPGRRTNRGESRKTLSGQGVGAAQIPRFGWITS